MKRPEGRLASLTPGGGNAPCLFDFQQVFLCMCSQEGLLDFETEKYVVFLPFIWAGSSSFLDPAVTGFLSTGNTLQGLALGPTHLLPNW